MQVSIIYPDKVDDSKGGILSHVDEVCELSSVHELAELLTLTHVAPAVFKDNRKRQDHLIQIEFICFDFDDGRISSADVHEQLKHKYNHVILGSKNHLKDKGDGRGPIERFHLFIPTDRPITDVEFYKYVCRKLAKLNLWSVDKNCIEPSRYFYRHSCILCEYCKAKPLDSDRFTKMHALEKQRQETRAPVAQRIGEGTATIDRFRETKYFRMMVDGVLKIDGSRYAISNSIIGAMKKCGLTLYDCLELFQCYSTWGKSFTRESVKRRFESWKQ